MISNLCDGFRVIIVRIIKGIKWIRGAKVKCIYCDLDCEWCKECLIAGLINCISTC